MGQSGRRPGTAGSTGSSLAVGGATVMDVFEVH